MKLTGFLSALALSLASSASSLLLFSPFPASGTSEASATPKSGDHPVSIGLVLQGGGALGFAHVGVLKVLEEEHIPVHVIAGTSMGAIVGAAYASGRSIKELEVVLTETDWDGLFNEAVPRQLLDYRMKSGRDGEIYGDSKIGIRDGGIVVPLALVEGQAIEPLLQKLFGRAPAACSFDALPVRYRAVAADIETGEAVILDSGSLALAARASMSVPGFFSPVEINGRLLVDGGITNNFPVDVARAMGPDVLIGVDFGFEPRKRDALTNPFAISAQILDLLLERTSSASRKLIGPNDILISPDLKGYTSTSFKSAREIMKAGEVAARLAIPRLKKLALSDSQYRTWAAKRVAGAEFAPVIDYIKVNAPANREEAIRSVLTVKPGEAFNRDQIAKEIQEIQQTGTYKKITADIEKVDGKHGLVVNAEEKEWLKNYMRVGFSLEDNFDGESNFALATEARMRDLNEAGGYFEGQVEIGRAPLISGELYQPIAQGSSFFVSPEVTLSRQELFIQRDGESVAEYTRESGVLGLRGGISFGRFGEFLAGWRRGPGRFEREIGSEEIPEFDYDIGEYVSRFVVDQLDNPDFPTEGFRVAVEGLVARESAGGSDDFEQGRVLASRPFTVDDVTLLLAAEGGSSSNGMPAERSFSMGGFFDISGFNKNSLAADDFWISRTSLYRRFAKGSSSLINFGGFYGASFEYASLRTSIEEIGDNPDIIAGSVFIGADTPLLPLYLGVGINDESERSIYLAVGRVGSRRR